jgi:5-methylcytosine-specific restriction endonuclease McrA
MLKRILVFFTLATLREVKLYKTKTNKLKEKNAKKERVLRLCRSISKKRGDKIKILEEGIFTLEKEIKLYMNMDSELDPKKLINFSFEVRKIGKCDICRSEKDLTAHHLWSKSLFPQLAYQFDNGVCLCDKCHKAFHKKYKLMIQITPKSYEKFKGLCIGQINMYGHIEYDNL